MSDTTFDPIRNDLIRRYSESSIAPVGSKESSIVQGAGVSLPSKKIDHNPAYFIDTMKKDSGHDPFQEIYLKLKESAESQKIPAEEVEEAMGDLYTMRHKMRCVGLDLDVMIMQAYRDQLSLDEFMSQVQEALYEVKRGELKHVHQEQLADLDKLIKKMKSAKIWGTFGKVFGAIAAISGGVATIATGGAAAVLGIALLAVTLANTTDNVLGDPMKRAIGKNVTDGSDDSVEKFNQWCNVGIGVLQTILGLSTTAMTVAAARGAQMGAQAATALGKTAEHLTSVASATAGVGEAVTTIAEASSNYSINLTKASHLENEVLSQRTDQELKDILELLNRALKQYYGHQQSLSQVADGMRAAGQWVR